MKRLFILIAACMVVFACGSGNEGVEYIKKAQKAVAKGQWEQAEEYMGKYAEWTETATDEEFAEAVIQLRESFGEISEEFYEGIVQGMTEGFGDYMESLSKSVEDIEEVFEQAGEEVEQAVEEAAKALEGMFK